MRHRAQATGGAAATLIGIITLLLIFYILFLPPEARRELLAEEPKPGEPGVPGAPRLTLLQAAPGRLSALGVTEFVHTLPNLLLQEQRQARVLASFNPFTIRKGWFRKEFKTLSFALVEPENTENVQLVFQAPVNVGKLRIFFNDQLVFEGDINVNNPPPVGLPKALLKPINSIEFQVWGLGLTSRQYQFADIKLVGDITQAEQQRAANVFSVPELEYENIESGYLAFTAICDQEAVSVLDITLNDRVVYSAVPVCDSQNRQDLFQEDFRVGKNTLQFRLRQGTARIEQVRIKNLVKPTKGWGEFFFIEPDLGAALAAGQAHVILDIEFVDDGKLKEAQLNVNGRLDMLSQREPRYARDITGIARDGNNYIEILPLTDLSIARLDVRVE